MSASSVKVAVTFPEFVNVRYELRRSIGLPGFLKSSFVISVKPKLVETLTSVKA